MNLLEEKQLTPKKLASLHKPIDKDEDDDKRQRIRPELSWFCLEFKL